MAQPSSGIPDMSALLGRPLTLGEERTLWHGFEERFAIDTEAARLKGEQQKLLLEGEKLKQSLLARAIESMTPGWERGGERVDVGKFQGKDVAVGPGQPGREITPATGPGVQYRQPGPEQQRMGQQLVRKTMGLTPEDPVEVFDREIAKIEYREDLHAKEARKTEEFRVGLETKKEAAGIEKLGVQEQARAKTAEKGKIAQLERELKKGFEDTLTKVQMSYDTKVRGMQSDPVFQTKPLAEQKSVLAELQDAYEATLGIVARRASQHGLTIDTSELLNPRDPSILNKEQIEWRKKASKQEGRAFDKAYEERFGKKHGVKGK